MKSRFLPYIAPLLVVLGQACLAQPINASDPVEFGKAELARAFEHRGQAPVPVDLNIMTGTPESYTVEPGSPVTIIGGDERGLMYGLLSAAEQVRAGGKILPDSGSPSVAMRGIRYFINNEDLEKDWYYSKEYWTQYFRMLARNRFNRLNLVFATQTDYLAPPYPFWVDVPTIPEIRVVGLAPEERQHNLNMLKYISDTASAHGVEFTLGIWQQNAFPKNYREMVTAGAEATFNVDELAPGTVLGLTKDNIGPYTYAALKKVLQLCPQIKSVQIRANAESSISPDQAIQFYGTYFIPALLDAGRPVILDLRAWLLEPGMLEAAAATGVPLRASAKYWAEHAGRPYPPATTWPRYSYQDLLRKERDYDFYWEIWTVGNNRLLLTGNPDYVRRVVPTLDYGAGLGFEIDAPLGLKGFGNAPGKYGIFADNQQHRVFWDWEFERYWMFYTLWGRLSYDPAAKDEIWMRELDARFGAASSEVMSLYREASRVMPELIAISMSDPNAYSWPEISPGALIDDYIYMRPSDWSYIASIPEAVDAQLGNVGSAKQTPQQSASLLAGIAAAVQRSIGVVDQQLGESNKEWNSSRMDFGVLALLAEYHAIKLNAAEKLQYFYRTGNADALAAAKAGVVKSISTWEELVKLTDGVYPAEMIYGPQDVGVWKDKLPYVLHDLKMIEEREAVFREFGRFTQGFDFGQANPPDVFSARIPYRMTPYAQNTNVEPRFTLATADSSYDVDAGFGWVGDAPLETVGIPLTNHKEIRAATKNPENLPHDVLYRDFVRSDHAQVFRVNIDSGEYIATLLHPDRKTTSRKLQSKGGHLEISIQPEDWPLSGLVLTLLGSSAAPVLQRADVEAPVRPALTHTPPSSAVIGKPLTLELVLPPPGNVTQVKLHYRAMNQLEEFKTVSQDAASGAFTIPGGEIPSDYDLMYYFEVLHSGRGGWFVPDPLAATPYYVVTTVKPGE
jgi:hypothetical protein